jgi:hypothetical protein
MPLFPICYIDQNHDNQPVCAERENLFLCSNSQILQSTSTSHNISQESCGFGLTQELKETCWCWLLPSNDHLQHLRVSVCLPWTHPTRLQFQITCSTRVFPSVFNEHTQEDYNVIHNQTYPTRLQSNTQSQTETLCRKITPEETIILLLQRMKQDTRPLVKENWPFRPSKVHKIQPAKSSVCHWFTFPLHHSTSKPDTRPFRPEKSE